MAGRFILTTLLCASLGTVTLGQPRDAATVFRETVGPFVDEHCVVCHGAELSTAGLDLHALVRSTSAPPDLEAWTRVADKLRSGQMPPPGRPRPRAGSINSVTRSIDAYLMTTGDTLTDDTPGRVTARRLNRVEYNNTVRSLLGVHGYPADEFPLDDSGYGFDNNGDVLSVSPLLLEKYMASARRLSTAAVFGQPVPDEPRLLARYMGKRSHDARGDLTGADILPYSMRGALDGSHLFPWDAEYEIRFRAANYRYSRQQLIARGDIEPEERDFRDPDQEYGLTEEERLARFLEDARLSQPPVPVVVTLDGEVVHEELIEGSNAFGYERGEFATRVSVNAGEHAFRLSYPHTANLDDPRDNLLGDGRRVLYVDYVDIFGPFNPRRERPASYDRLFICRHRPGQHSAQCAGEVVASLARRAYRRPVTDDEVQALVALVRQAEDAGDSFEDGVQLAVQAVLVSPHFLFRFEREPTDQSPRVLDDHELASRLSYFLWADMPDSELFALADDGVLDDPEVLRAQTLRMLRHPKARSLVDDFAAQWLQLRSLEAARPDPVRFPTVDDELRHAMRTETELFLEAILREDRSVLEILDAPFTFVNGPLARHYGISGVDGEAFQRVSLDGPQRGGLLSHGSVLTVSSYPTRTSPVLRGKWVLEALLGAPPPDPPPDVPVLEETTANRSLSLREQMEQHRADPGCAVCHDQIDPLGFGLEKYDATGAWRTYDGEVPINDTGTLPDGTSFRGPAGLRAVLRAQADAFRRNLSEKLLTYALGRGLEPHDRAAVNAIVTHAGASDDRWSAFVIGVVESAPFRMLDSEDARR